LPEQVDPDHWLAKVHDQFYKRRIQANGSVQIGKHYYYIRRALKGQQVLLQVDAVERQFKVLLNGKPIKHLAIKGLYQGIMDFEAFLALICREAESEWQKYLHRQRCGRR
jgi:hypothetical protein